MDDVWCGMLCLCLVLVALVRGVTMGVQLLIPNRLRTALICRMEGRIGHAVITRKRTVIQ